MMTDLYEHYLYVVGKLKDIHKLHIEVDHRDIHTFYAGKVPVFKLLFGTYSEHESKSIVVSFHAELPTVAAIQWYLHIRKIHPPIILSNVYFEDFTGEIFYGEDADKIISLKRDQECLKDYLENLDKEEIREFVEQKVVGRIKESVKLFTDDRRNQAIKEFEHMKKPVDDGEVQ